MIHQASSVVLVLFFLMIVVTQFSRDNLVVAQSAVVPAQSSCPYTCEDKVTTSVDTTLSIIGCIGSVIVALSPGLRVVSKRIDGLENQMKDRWFMVFLGVMTVDYVFWTAYSFNKCFCDARIYMLVSSVAGVAVSGLYFLIGIVREIGHIIDPAYKWSLPSLYLIVGSLGFLRQDVNGYAVMIGTFIAHVCRVLGMDYTRFSGVHCFVSFIGAASGFLSVRHPHLIKEQPFRITSIVLAGVRVIELIWWLLLFVLSEKSTQRVVPESELQPPVWQPRGPIQQTREYMKELQNLNM